MMMIMMIIMMIRFKASPSAIAQFEGIMQAQPGGHRGAHGLAAMSLAAGISLMALPGLSPYGPLLSGSWKHKTRPAPEAARACSLLQSGWRARCDDLRNGRRDEQTQ